MIIKVKTNGNELSELESMLIERKKSNVYDVKPENLNYVLDYLKSNGIIKVKLDLTDFYKLDKPVIKLKEKPTLMEYLEYVFNDEIDELEVAQSLEAFFKKIEFVDIDDCFLRLYNEIVSLSEEEFNEYLIKYKGNRNGIYSYIIIKTFNDFEESRKFRNKLKKSIHKYFEENIWMIRPDGTGYKDLFPNGIPYSAFIKFLLKHTGRKYY